MAGWTYQPSPTFCLENRNVKCSKYRIRTTWNKTFFLVFLMFLIGLSASRFDLIRSRSQFHVQGRCGPAGRRPGLPDRSARPPLRSLRGDAAVVGEQGRQLRPLVHHRLHRNLRPQLQRRCAWVGGFTASVIVRRPDRSALLENKRCFVSLAVASLARDGNAYQVYDAHVLCCQAKVLYHDFVENLCDLRGSVPGLKQNEARCGHRDTEAR